MTNPATTNVKHNTRSPIHAIDPLLKTEQVLEQIGMKRTWLHYAELDGRFPNGIKIGRSKRWKQSVVTQWIADRENEIKH